MNDLVFEDFLGVDSRFSSYIKYEQVNILNPICKPNSNKRIEQSMHLAFRRLRSTPTYTSKMCDRTPVRMDFQPVLLWQKHTNPVPFTPISPSFLWHTNGAVTIHIV